MADELKGSTAGAVKAAAETKAAAAKQDGAPKLDALRAPGAKAGRRPTGTGGASPAGAAKPAAKRKPAARPVPKSALTRRYDAVKERVWAGAAKVRAAFFSDSWAGGAMWFAAVLVMIAVLLWFFFFSDFGTPAEPIYEGF